MLTLTTSSYTDNANDKLADQHTQGSPDQNSTTTKSLNNPEGKRGRADIDEGCNQTDQERVADRTKLLEEGGAEIKDKIDARLLLHHLTLVLVYLCLD